MAGFGECVVCGAQLASICNLDQIQERAFDAFASEEMLATKELKTLPNCLYGLTQGLGFALLAKTSSR